jgi:hypothetical protein
VREEDEKWRKGVRGKGGMGKERRGWYRWKTRARQRFLAKRQKLWWKFLAERQKFGYGMVARGLAAWWDGYGMVG